MTTDRANKVIADYMGVNTKVDDMPMMMDGPRQPLELNYHRYWEEIMPVAQKLGKELKGREQLRILMHVLINGKIYNIFEVCATLIKFHTVNARVTDEVQES